MGVFTADFRKQFFFTDMENKEYELICNEYNTVASSYSIKTELYSKRVWEYINKTFSVDKQNILSYTEIEMDEKNKKHKLYKYVVKCIFDNSHNSFIYLVFNDEERGFDDSDYHEYVTENDKSNKIYNMTIYFDSNKISNEYIDTNIAKELIDCSYIPTTKNQFFTISTTQHGFSLKPSYIRELDMKLEFNYGSKFLPISDKIIDRLTNSNKGLFLFHGVPGSGKTQYLRYLISMLSEEKTIIYVPSSMMYNIADPEFVSFIGGFKDTLLLLEDAENILANTVDDRSQAVSNILNMTDGLLNDYMDIQIIATFNTDAKLIDNALKRAGRLQISYKFNKLSKTDANILAKELGLTKTFESGATLAEIYEGANQIIEDDLQTENKIGFRK